jgi:hypothetical protein
MSFGQDEEELDWGDVVDVVSLGDEEENLNVGQVDEDVVQESAPTGAPQEGLEPAQSPTKNGSTASIHPLGLSHLPPKPQSVVPGGRSRETIKAAAMSRTYLRSRSPPGSSPNDLPRNWEVRRSETSVYYYHTVLHASQWKRPTRDDPRLDKSHWEGEEPPKPSDRSQSVRNASSVRTVRIRIRATARPHYFLTSTLDLLVT